MLGPVVLPSWQCLGCKSLSDQVTIIDGPLTSGKKWIVKTFTKRKMPQDTLSLGFIFF